MVHSTRKNYKTKLQSRAEDVGPAGLEGSASADRVYDFIEQESLAKRQLAQEIVDLGEMAVDVVKMMDKSRLVGRLTFSECQEVNDDVIGKKSAFDIIDRAFEILMTAEERIGLYAEQLTALEVSEKSLKTKIATIQGKMAEATQLQHELYNIGKGATESEIQAFRDAETAGKKYHRFSSDSTEANIRQAPPSPPATPEQITDAGRTSASAPPAGKPVQIKKGAGSGKKTA